MSTNRKSSELSQDGFSSIDIEECGARFQSLPGESYNTKSICSSAAPSEANSSIGVLSLDKLSDLSFVSEPEAKLHDLWTGTKASNLTNKIKMSHDVEFDKNGENIGNDRSRNYDLESDLQLRMQRSLAQKVLEKSNASLADSSLDGCSTSLESLHIMPTNKKLEKKNYESSQDLINIVKSGSAMSKKELNISASSFESFRIDRRSAQSTPHFVYRRTSSRNHDPETSESGQVDNSEEFMDADKFQEKLLADELSWQKKYAILPVSNTGKRESDEVSSLSGLSGDAEISVGSTLLGSGAGRIKLTADDYFKLKTCSVGSLEFKERTNQPYFGCKALSPDRNPLPTPLVESVSFTDVSTTRNDGLRMESNDHHEPLDSGSEYSSRSIISVSSIQKLMADEGNLITPRTLYRNVMNFAEKKSLEPVASNIKISTSISDDGNNSRKMLKMPLSPLDISCWIENGNESNNIGNVEVSAACLHEKLDKEKEDSWVDVEFPGGYKCVKGCIGMTSSQIIRVKNLTNKRIKCVLKHHKVMCEGDAVNSSQAAHIILPPKTVLLEPYGLKDAKILLVPLIAENISVTLNLHLEDIDGQLEQNSLLTFKLKGEEPQIKVLISGTNESDMDFGTLAENCSCSVPLMLVNMGCCDVYLHLSIEKQNHQLPIFSMLVNTGDDLENSKLESSLTCLLEANSRCYVEVTFNSPSFEEVTNQTGIVDLCGELRIELESCFGENILVKTVLLHGCVGRTELMFLKKNDPFILPSDSNESVSQIFPIKNNSAIPLSLSFKIFDEELNEVSDDVICVKPNSLIVEAERKAGVKVIFHPRDGLMVVRRLLITEIEPNGQIFTTQIHGVRTSVKEKSLTKTSKIRSQIIDEAVDSSRTLACNEMNRISSENLQDIRQGESAMATAAGSKKLEVKMMSSRSKTQGITEFFNEKHSGSGSKRSTFSASTIDTKHPDSLEIKLPVGSDGSGFMSSNSNVKRPSSAAKSSYFSQNKSSSRRLHLTATQQQLVWNSVPVGDQKTESFMLRNEGQGSIDLHVSLQNASSGFKILTEQGRYISELKLVIHSMERVKFTISFEPSKLGAAYDKVIFKKYSATETAGKLVIPLYAYGGHHKVVVKGVPRDGSGHMWLCIGSLDLGKPLMEAFFIISNTGTLDSFVTITVTSKGLDFLSKSSLKTEPSRLIIPAKGAATIKVVYQINKEEFKHFLKTKEDITEVGMLCLVCGDEPNRQRVRRIWNTSKANTSDSLSNSCTSMSLSNICDIFPEETLVSDLETLKDPECAIGILCRSFTTQNIFLIVEKNAEKSCGLRLASSTENQSQIFKSLYNETLNETLDRSVCEDFESRNHSSFWTVSSESLVLAPPRITEGCIQVFNKSEKPQIFETQLSNKCVCVVPSEGIVPPHSEIILTVSCSSLPKTCGRVVESQLKVYLENDVKQIRIIVKQGA